MATLKRLKQFKVVIAHRNVYQTISISKNTTAIDLSKRQELDADQDAIQQIRFTGILSRAEDISMFFIIEEAKETVLDISKGAVNVLKFYFLLI